MFLLSGERKCRILSEVLNIAGVQRVGGKRETIGGGGGEERDRELERERGKEMSWRGYKEGRWNFLHSLPDMRWKHLSFRIRFFH